jgi:hypothetical protein
MPARRLLPLLTALIALGLGIVAVPTLDEQTPQLVVEIETFVATPSPEARVSSPLSLSEDNCGEWDGDEDIPLRTLVRKWLRGEQIKDVPYCSKTAIEATGYNVSNVHPELIDLNDDGVDELAIRYFCSPTGNCSMKIYQRIGRFSREIFADRQMVNYFEKVGGFHAGFSDFQTRSHGSCCDGDQVVYRFNGKTYEPVSCAEYSYWDGPNPGQVNEKAVITKRRCSQVLDPVP